jgi:hypothetical protein
VGDLGVPRASCNEQLKETQRAVQQQNIVYVVLELRPYLFFQLSDSSFVIGLTWLLEFGLVHRHVATL